MFRLIPSIVVALVALALVADAAAVDLRPSPRSAPDWQATIAPGAERTYSARVCGGLRPSDVHAYHARTGGAFRQRRDRGGIYWSRGARVAASLYGRTFVAETNRMPVIVAVWCDR